MITLADDYILIPEFIIHGGITTSLIAPVSSTT